MNKNRKTLKMPVRYLMNAVLVVLLFLALSYMTGNMLSTYQNKVLMTVGINIILAVSLNVATGYLGQLPLGHAGFMAVGAYTCALFTKYSPLPDGVSFAIGLALGAVMAGIFGVIVGVPVLRLSGDYLAIVTLAFGEIIKNIMNAVYLGVDDSGLHFSLKDAASMNMAEDGKILINGAMGITGIKKTSTFTMGIILVLITLVVVLNLIRSRAGRAISAIRDNEIAAKSIGINITRYKLMAFVLSSVFAGMAGVLYSLNYSSLVAKKFDYNTSINILVFVVLGGIGSIRGSVIAAAILTVLPEMLRGLNDYRMLIYAIVLIVMMIFTRSPKLVAWRKEVAEKITEKFPILKLNKFLKDKSKKEAA